MFVPLNSCKRTEYRTRNEVANLAALRGYSDDPTSVNVDGYNSPNDGGGGQFVQHGTILDGSCNASDDDDGVVIVNTGGNGRCWYRQFSGPVHLSWYGVPDAASSMCYTADHYTGCDATGLVQKALAAAGNRVVFPGADGGVTTDGRSIAILTHCGGCIDTDSGIAINEGQYFTCEGPPGARRDLSEVFTAPASLVLHPGLT